MPTSDARDQDRRAPAIADPTTGFGLTLDALSRLLAWTANRPADPRTREPRMRELLRRICPGLEPLTVVKVAGTNGKGSVCAMLEACLGAGGKRVGLFTSPHLQRVTERIRLGGREISGEALEAYAERIEPVLLGLVKERGTAFIPYFFEVMLLIAIRVFLDHGIEYAILEAGIGGGRDAVALIPGPVSVVTSVAFDHESRLGLSLRQIASEKARVATADSTLVLGPRIGDELRREAERALASMNVRILQADQDRTTLVRADARWSVVRVGFPEGDAEVKLPLAGEHQVDNLATVAAVLDLLVGPGEPTVKTVIPGVSGTVWHGRFEYVEGAPGWLLDGAHNEEAIRALVAGIRTYFSTRHRTLVFGASREKSYVRYVELLCDIATETYVTDDFYSGEDRRILSAGLPSRLCARTWDASIGDLVRMLQGQPGGSGRLIVVTGSLFLVGKVRDALATMWPGKRTDG